MGDHQKEACFITVTLWLRARIAQSVQCLAYGLDDPGCFLAGERDFSLFEDIQTGSGAYPASSSMGTGGKVAGVSS
jgi:hypothetical protein